MEYLMTYGWAILIIAVVLGALYSLGVFNSASLTPQGCIAVSGFYCQNAVYHSANLAFTFGQATGTNWASTTLIFVPYGQTFSSGLTPNAVLGSINSGQTSAVTINSIPVSWAGNTIGSALQGSIYAVYTLSGSATPYSLQVATITLKST